MQISVQFVFLSNVRVFRQFSDPMTDSSLLLCHSIIYFHMKLQLGVFGILVSSAGIIAVWMLVTSVVPTQTGALAIEQKCKSQVWCVPLGPAPLAVEAAELSLKPGQTEKHEQHNEILSDTNTHIHTSYFSIQNALPLHFLYFQILLTSSYLFEFFQVNVSRKIKAEPKKFSIILSYISSLEMIHQSTNNLNYHIIYISYKNKVSLIKQYIINVSAKLYITDIAKK